MGRLSIALTLVVVLGAVMAAPSTATSTRIPTSCVEHRLTDWTGGREWIDEDFTYHSRGRTATYQDVGAPYCAGWNEAIVSVNLDLTTGEGLVIARGRITLDAFDGGWDGLLVAHFTPGGPHIWEGMIVGQGFGVLTGWQWRADVAEDSHEVTHYSGFVFSPGS